MGLKVFTNSKIHKPKVCSQHRFYLEAESQRLYDSSGKKKITKINCLIYWSKSKKNLKIKCDKINKKKICDSRYIKVPGSRSHSNTNLKILIASSPHIDKTGRNIRQIVKVLEEGTDMQSKRLLLIEESGKPVIKTLYLVNKDMWSWKRKRKFSDTGSV